MPTLLEQLRVEVDQDPLQSEARHLGALSLRQRAIVSAVHHAVRVERLRTRTLDRATTLAQLAPPAPAPPLQPRPDPHVPPSMRRRFVQTGLAGPLPFCAPREATTLAAHLRRLLIHPGNPLRAAIEQAGAAPPEDDPVLARDAFMYDPVVRMALLSATVTEPVAALLGVERVACVRSDLLRHRPGDLPPRLAQGRGARGKSLDVYITLAREPRAGGTPFAFAGAYRETRVAALAASFARRPADLLTCLAFLPDDEVTRLLPVLLFARTGEPAARRAVLQLATLLCDDLFGDVDGGQELFAEPGQMWACHPDNVVGALPGRGGERLTLVARYADAETVDGNELVVDLDRPVRIDPAAHGWTAVAHAPHRRRWARTG